MSKRQGGPMGGGPHGGMGAGEKAKDFKGTIKKLMKYLSEYKIGLIFVLLFAIGSTIFNIAGPKILGKATTEIFTGLVGKVSGSSGIYFDFPDVPVCNKCNIFIHSGIYYDGCVTEADVSPSKRDFRENQSYADELF